MSVGSGSIRVLHLDDEPEFAEMTAEFLTREDDRIAVETVSSVEEGFDRLEDGAFDCVVSDYEMPDGNGIEFLEGVRERNPDLPFILFTGKGSEEVASDAIAAGATDYLRKRPEGDQYALLANRIRNAVDRYRADRERRRNERRFEAVLDDPNMLVGLLDPDGTLRRANRTAMAFVDADREDVIGEPFPETPWWPGEMAADVERWIERAAAGEYVEYEADLRRPGGEPYSVIGTVRPVRDDAGTVTSLIVSAREVTERRERERELREKTRQLEALVENTTESIYIKDLDGRYVFANRAAADDFGLDPEEIIGARDAELFDDESAADVRKADERIVETGENETYESVRYIDGERRVFLNDKHPYRDEEGEVVGIVGISRDITERKEREEELELFRRLLDHSNDGIYVIDPETSRFIDVNGTACERLGYDREELLDLGVVDVTAAGGLDEWREHVESVQEGGGAFVGRHVRKDGSTYPVEIDTAHVEVEGQEYLVSITRDLTGRRAEEHERRRYEAILESMEEAVFMITPDGTYEYVNEAAIENTGQSREELIGSPATEFLESGMGVDEGELAEYSALIDRLIEGEVETGRQVISIAGLGRDGVTIEVALSRVESDHGDLLGVAGVVHDITDIEERERTLQALHDATRSLMAAETREEVFERGIEAAETILGLDLATFNVADGDVLDPVAVTKQIDEIPGDPDPFERGSSVAWEVFETGEAFLTDDIREHPKVHDPDTPIRGEMIIPLGDHGVFIASSLREGAFDETDASLAKVLVSNMEAALDRAERERTLRDRERSLHSLQTATQELMVAETREEVFERGIEAAETILGLEAASFHVADGGTLRPAVVADDTEELVGSPPELGPGSVAWEVFETGEAFLADDVREHPKVHNPDTALRSELIIPLGDHGVFIASSLREGAFDETDASLARVLIANVEAALDRAEREEERERQRRELERRNDHLDEFASVVSHDLRNPLNVATGHLELVDVESEHLDAVERALDRMNRIIEGTLTLARSGRTVGELEPVDLSALAEGCWRNVATADARIRVEDVPTIDADPDRVRQLLENLFRNAVEHGSTANRTSSDDAVEHGSTASRASLDDAVEHGSTASDAKRHDADERGSGVEVVVGALPGGFYVEDDGPGIPPERREDVFDAGYSGTDDGSGLGLAIVRRIAEAHGWRVEVTEGEAGGARFEITGVDFAEGAPEETHEAT